MNGYDPTVREYLLSSAEKTIASQDRGGLRLCHTINNYVASLQSVTTQSGQGFSINAYVSFDDKHRLMICAKVFNVLTFTDVVNAAEAETQTGGHESCFDEGERDYPQQAKRSWTHHASHAPFASEHCN